MKGPVRRPSSAVMRSSAPLSPSRSVRGLIINIPSLSLSTSSSWWSTLDRSQDHFCDIRTLAIAYHSPHTNPSPEFQRFATDIFERMPKSRRWLSIRQYHDPKTAARSEVDVITSSRVDSVAGVSLRSSPSPLPHRGFDPLSPMGKRFLNERAPWADDDPDDGRL